MKSITYNDRVSTLNNSSSIGNSLKTFCHNAICYVGNYVSKLSGISKISNIATKIIKFVQIIFGEEYFPVLNLIKKPVKAVKHTTSTLKLATKTHDLLALNSKAHGLHIAHKVTSFATTLLKTVKFFGSLGLLNLGKYAAQIGKIPIFGIISKLPLGIVINMFQFTVNVLGAIEDALEFFTLNKKINNDETNLTQWQRRNREIEEILQYVKDETKLSYLKAQVFEENGVEQDFPDKRIQKDESRELPSFIETSDQQEQEPMFIRLQKADFAKSVPEFPQPLIDFDANINIHAVPHLEFHQANQAFLDFENGGKQRVLFQEPKFNNKLDQQEDNTKKVPPRIDKGNKVHQPINQKTGLTESDIDRLAFSTLDKGVHQQVDFEPLFSGLGKKPLLGNNLHPIGKSHPSRDAVKEIQFVDKLKNPSFIDPLAINKNAAELNPPILKPQKQDLNCNSIIPIIHAKEEELLNPQPQPYRRDVPLVIKETNESRLLQKKINDQRRSIIIKREALKNHYQAKINAAKITIEEIQNNAEENKGHLENLNAKVIKWENIARVVIDNDEKALNALHQKLQIKIEEKTGNIVALKQAKIQQVLSFLYRTAKVVLAVSSIFLFFTGFGATPVLAGFLILHVVTYSFGIFKFFWHETHRKG